MEIKKEDTLLLNVISDSIAKVKEDIRRSERHLAILKKAQRYIEEMYMSEEDGDIFSTV